MLLLCLRLLISVTLVFFVGCISRELTREKAKGVLESSEVHRKQMRTLNLSPEEVNALTRNGYLQWNGFPSRTLEPTLEGLSTLISGATGEMIMGIPRDDIQLTVSLLKEMKAEVIEITGIAAQDQNTRIVEYRWRWESEEQPEPLRRLLPSLTSVKTGKVLMRLYDDGWRVVWK